MHMKSCSTLLIIREMYMETTMRHRYTSTAMATIKRKDGMLDRFRTCRSCAPLVRTYSDTVFVWNTEEVHQKMKTNYHISQQYYFWIYIQKNSERISTRTTVLFSLLHCTQWQRKKQSKQQEKMNRKWEPPSPPWGGGVRGFHNKMKKPLSTYHAIMLIKWAS